MSQPPVVPGTVLLHVGPQKTGSTALQSAMEARAPEMREHGVHYAGRAFEAGWAVLGKGAPIGAPAPGPHAWDDLAEEIRSTHLPRVCLSNEDLGRADDAAVDRIAGSLGPDRIQLVYVARRLDRLLPSQWQQRVKARMRLSWPDYLRMVFDETSTDWERRLLWSPQDVAAVVARWRRRLEPGQVTVVVADEHDHRAVPRWFETALGLPEGLLTPPRQAGANRSLSYPEVELLRRVNEVFAGQDLPGTAYRRIVQGGLAKRLVNAPRPPDAPPIPGFPGWAVDLVADRCDAQADALEALAASGVHVVGDPGTLRVRGRLVADDDPPVVASVSMDLLGEAVAGLLTGAMDLQRREVRTARAQARAVEPARASAPDALGGRELARELGHRVLRRLRRSARG
ncbi:MAG: hypothetical protein ACTHNS_05120 [Marmoricola sp.]